MTGDMATHDETRKSGVGEPPNQLVQQTDRVDSEPTVIVQPPNSIVQPPTIAIQQPNGVVEQPSEKPQPDIDSVISQNSEIPGLPLLEYNIWDYKTKLFIVAGLLVIESSLLPVALFYGLWYATSLRHGIIFAIITSFFGLVTGIEFALRSWKLILPKDTYRPVNSGRWKFDFTHYTLSFGYFYMTAILIGASIPHEPLIRPLALPVPLFFIQVGVQLIVTGWMEARNIPAPCRISSVPKGARMPPLLLTIVEDVVGVDGAGGQAYRLRLMARYAVSPRFKSMILRMNWFWGIGSLVLGLVDIIVLWLIPEEIGYGVAWSVPLVFSVIWTAITIHWAHQSVGKEKELWKGTIKSSKGVV